MKFQQQFDTSLPFPKMEFPTIQAAPGIAPAPPSTGDQAKQVVGPESKPAKNEPAGRVGLLDSIIFALTGTPEQLLTDKQIAEKRSKRQRESAMAVDAYNNPGESFMGPPVAGGKSLIGGLGDIAKFIGGIF